MVVVSNVLVNKKNKKLLTKGPNNRKTVVWARFYYFVRVFRTYIMFIKKSKRIHQFFVPVAEIHLLVNPIKTAITSQQLHVALRNFVRVFRSYNRLCL
jgi:hypothetical protein